MRVYFNRPTDHHGHTVRTSPNSRGIPTSLQFYRRANGMLSECSSSQLELEQGYVRPHYWYCAYLFTSLSWLNSPSTTKLTKLAYIKL